MAAPQTALTQVLEEEDPQTALTKALEEEDNPGQEKAGYGTAILNELIKSYGFNRSADGDWSWSVDTIKKSFKDDPVWTSIDWLITAVPPLRWGSAAAKVARGQGAMAAAYKKGKVGLKEATKAQLAAGIPRTRFGQVYGSPVADDMQDFLKIAKDAEVQLHYGERRHLNHILQRELKADEAYYQRSAEDLLRAQKGLDEKESAEISKLLSGGFKPDSDEARRVLRTDQGRETFDKLFHFRNEIHEQGFRWGAFSRTTYERRLYKNNPRLYAEYQKIGAKYRAASPFARFKPGVEARIADAEASHQKIMDDAFNAGRELTKKENETLKGLEDVIDKLQGREKTLKEDFEVIWSAAVTTEQLGKAAQHIMKQKYASKLADSAVLQKPSDVIDYLSKATPRQQKLFKIDSEAVGAATLVRDGAISELPGDWASRVKALEGNEEALAGLVEEASHKVLQDVGWKKLEDLSDTAQIPDAWKGLYADPNVARDIEGILKIFDAPWMSDFQKTLTRGYFGSMGLFRATKTAYNLATHFRNAFGAMVNHNLATGSSRAFYTALARGRELYHEGGERYAQALRAGVLGSSFDKEVQDVLKAAGKQVDEFGRATAVDFLGTSAVAQFLQKGAGKAERFYRAIDEVAKLDAFDHLMNRYSKQIDPKTGLKQYTTEEAIQKATLEVHKYFPNFLQHSQAADFIRKNVPFASFATESLRTWGNAFTFKPHLAFMWNHLFEGMTYTIGAMNGYSAEEIDAAQQTLPEYQQNKKNLLLPFKVNGKPSFLDMSYLVPMANIVEMEQSHNAMFEIVDPTQNPFLSALVGASTGVDPFSQRKIEPRFTEQQLGITIESPGARKLVGMGEHLAAMFTPPLSPNNYAGTNLLELARGQKDPRTGQPLQEGWIRTIFANVIGFRAHEASVKGQILNVRREDRRIHDAVKVWRDKHKFAKAQGDEAAVAQARDRIIELRNELDGKGLDYYEKNSPNWENPIQGIGNRQLGEISERIKQLEAFGELTPEDQILKNAIRMKLEKKK